MAIYPVITGDDGITPLVIPDSTVEAGDSEAPLEFWAVNDPGSLHGDASAIPRSYVAVEGWDGEKWVRGGLPFLDDRWISMTVFGQDNGSDPLMSVQLTQSYPVGTGRVLWLDEIAPGGVRKIALVLHSHGPASTSMRYRLIWDPDQSSVVLGTDVFIATGSGVVPSRRTGRQAVVDGMVVQADGSDTLTITRGLWASGMSERVHLSENLTLDLNASDGALIAGQKYYVLISKNPEDDSTTITKGAKGVTPLAPIIPAGEMPLSYVQVHYDSGGAPVIVQGNVDQSIAPLGDLRTVLATGLTVTSYPGLGLGGDRESWLPKSLVGVPDDSFSRIWKTPSGSREVTDQSDSPSDPSSDALADVTSASGNVSSIVDLRREIDLPQNILYLESTISAVLSTAILPMRMPHIVIPDSLELFLMSLDVDQSDVIWDGGSVKVDLLEFDVGEDLAGLGTTVFTGSAGDDARPAVAFDASSLREESRWMQVRRFSRGARLVPVIVETPSAPMAEPSRTVTVQLLLRRYA